MRRKVIIRDGKCIRCKIVYPLIVHHKDFNEFNNKEDNLEALCPNCHFKLHKGETLEDGQPWRLVNAPK